MIPLPRDDCWNRIGVRGDRSCPELAKVLHCHSCPVFAAAGRRFLDTPSPPGYVEEWTERLAAPPEEPPTDLESGLIFRLGDEWLALPVGVLVEVTAPRKVHRVPHRGGLLAGLVNVRGELHLCIRLDRLLGIDRGPDGETAPERSDQAPGRPGPALITVSAAGDGRVNGAASPGMVPTAPPSGAEARPARGGPRMLLVRREGERWVFPADEVDGVYRFPTGALARVPATLARSVSRLSRGVLPWKGRSVGCLDVDLLFQALRARVR